MADLLRWILVGLFAFLGFGILSGARGARGRILFGFLAGASCYLGAAAFAVVCESFVPLAVGFCAAWALRLLRLETGWPDQGVIFEAPQMGIVRMQVVPQMHLIEMLLAQNFDGVTTEEVVEEYWRLKQPGAAMSREGLRCLQVLEGLGLVESAQASSAP